VFTSASRTITEAQAEVAHQLAEHDAATAGDPVTEAQISRAWESARRQLNAGVDWTKILADVEARHDLDIVRAIRAELSGWAMAKAGAPKGARTRPQNCVRQPNRGLTRSWPRSDGAMSGPPLRSG